MKRSTSDLSTGSVTGSRGLTSSRLEPQIDVPTAFTWVTTNAKDKLGLVDELSDADDSSSSSDESSSSVEEKEQCKTDFRTTCIYGAFCLGVQMFMSYDSGATSASLDTIRDSGVVLTQTEVGILGSIDKVGQTIFSVVWGRALQLVPAKRLMVCSLLANALFSLMFGVVANKWAMFAAKFAQGATEALQGIWGTVWTLANAPAHLRSTWMGLGAIAAGLGNGLGTTISGFATANGLPYSVAFIFQASVLGLFWLGVVTTKSWRLNLPGSPGGAEFQEDAPGSTPSAQDVSSYSQAKALLQNKLYLLTVSNVAQVFFFNSGVQYIWTRLFVEGPWRLDKNWVVLGFLLVTGVGSFLGVAIGPPLIDRAGGYADAKGKYTTLRLLVRFAMFASLGSAAAIAYTMLKLANASDNPVEAELEALTRTPYLLWFIIMFVFLAQNATIATHSALCCEAVPPEMQSFATGVTVAVQNLFGYAAGAFVPGVVMDQAYSLWKLVGPMTNLDWGERGLSMRAQLGIGFMFACTSTFTLMVTVSLAAREARSHIVASDE